MFNSVQNPLDLKNKERELTERFVQGERRERT